ncbi:mechanosensitive ion channel domain-containing protein [Chromatocurvus halotolerans]|uniref:Small-conductance mechanosensitive channel n=1 Tax=Chromatocurvus halotolerans TaxID=1132028 RepID=A0A4R2KTN7_9GAMM|nr:mechanosensitive ion channel domain-containing protein [Chromatocurvus halotolerans]TCO74466.1 small-conductance mechanosensitive channel [Chromatocurvus halotolerans]
MSVTCFTRQWSAALLLFCCTTLSLLASAQQHAIVEPETPPVEADLDPALVAQEYARTARDDARIATRLSARLARHDDLQGVNPRVSAGVVVLSGTVLDAADRELAELIAASIEGVISVQQRIAINASLSDRVSPALAQSREKLMRLIAALPLLLVAAGVALGFVWLGRWLAGRLHLLRWGIENPYLDSVLRRGVQLVMLMAGVLIALDLLGATALVGAVLGSAGILGIILGLAFKEIAENHLAGVLLNVRRPFSPGDHIIVNEHEGKVISLNSRATVLMTLDGNHLRLPNAMVFKGVLLNYSRNPLRRLQFTLAIGLEQDLTAVRLLGLETLRNMPATSTEPEPQAIIRSVGDSSVLIDFSAWIDQREVDFLKTRSEAIRQVKCAIEDAGMDTPEPIHRVQLIRARTDSEDTDAAAAAKQRERKPRPHDNIEADVSVNHDLDVQVARERATELGQDLLQHAAPKE